LPTGEAMTRHIVISGETSSGIDLRAADAMSVPAGGTAVRTLVNPGVSLDESGTVAQPGVELFSGSVLISAAAELSGLTVGANETEYAYSGTAIDTLIVSGGMQLLSSAGIADASTIGAGGTVLVYNGGVASGAVVEAQGLLQVIGGIASNTTIASGGQGLEDHGFQHDLQIQSGGFESSYGGVLSGVTVNGGVISSQEDLIANLTVQAGGSAVLQSTASNVQVASASLIINYGQVSALTLSAGGFAELTQGSISDITVQSGGLALIENGGVVSGGTIDAGGTMILLPTARETNVAVDPGGKLVTTGVVVLAGSAVEQIGATLSGVTLDAGASAYVLAGGSAVDFSVRGEMLEVFAGGVVTSAMLSAPAAGTVVELVSSGGVDRATTIGAGAVQQIAMGGSASFETVLSGGMQIVEGVARNVMVESGGIQSVGRSFVSGQPAAAAYATLVFSGGAFEATSGAIVSGIILSGGDAYISDATASATVIRNGGTLFLTSGNTSGTVVSAGGVETVQHADAYGTVISAGGLLLVGDGGEGFHDEVGYVSGTDVLSGGELYLSGSPFQGGPISNARADATHIAAGGTVDLEYQLYTSDTTAQFDPLTDILTISGGGEENTLQLSGTYTDEYFQTTNDGAGGTDITAESVACYCPGTRILTDHGEVPIEELTIGDLLITGSGEVLPLRWIGHRSYDGRFVHENRAMLPVTLCAGCLDGELPRRDLTVSPLHALYLDGVLIPAVALVDGLDILQPDSIAQVAYLHLELDRHAIIFAEGAASESYVEDANRGMFHNAANHAVLYPHSAPVPAIYCAPRAEDGPTVAEVRRRIAQRRAPQIARACRGYIDHVDRGCIIGWAMDDANPAARVTVRLRDNGVVIGTARADHPRDDLRDNAIGNGGHGFVFTIPGGLAPGAPHEITAETTDGTQLAGEASWSATPTQAQDKSTVLRCHVDLINRNRVLGWALNQAAPGHPLALRIMVNGMQAGQTLANRYRRDVAESGQGNCAFEHTFLPPLDPFARHSIELRCESGGALLAPPVVLEPTRDFSPELQAAISAAVAGLADTGTEERVLSILEAQAAKLRKVRGFAPEPPLGSGDPKPQFTRARPS
jgi:autotransporter passenger strand-loop-strand repeat protein